MPRPRSFVPGTQPLSLLHIHLPRLIPYTLALSLQTSLLALHWTHRTHLKTTPPLAAPSPSLSRTTTTQTNDITPQPPLPPPPPPILLTFSTPPTYTVGRRHLQTNPLSRSQIDFLTRNGSAATFHASTRGGLLTYHGPGQLTGFPLVDLRRFGLSARCYVRMVEESVIRVCDGLLAEGGSEARRRAGRSEEDPGVWMVEEVDEREGGGGVRGVVSQRKVCAVGVQVSRGVSGFGVGLNVRDEEIVGEEEKGVMAFDDTLEGGKAYGEEKERGYLSWGFGRIVACGLEGKSTTWLTKEGASEDLQVGTVAARLAEELVKGINRMGNGKEKIRDVHTLVVGEREVEGLEEGAMKIEELFPD